MRTALAVMAASVALLSSCTSAPVRPTAAEAREQVMATERAFAKTMADRDPKAFAEFLSEQAVFFSGLKVLRGKAQITEAWAQFYQGPTVPFSWEPEQVEVLESGDLAHSSGPVRDPQGKLIAQFNSIWRYEAPGVWRIVFDKGSPVCADKNP